MKITSSFIQLLHLDPNHLLLNARSVQLVLQLFNYLDIRGKGELDSVAFLAFMEESTNLGEDEIRSVFDIFDVDKNGTMEFDEFYLLLCMLIALKDNLEKQFIWKHSRTCFELLDEDGSNAISLDEFENFGFIFNITRRASKTIFKEFDIDGSKALDYEEFRMFALAAIDRRQNQRND